MATLQLYYATTEMEHLRTLASPSGVKRTNVIGTVLGSDYNNDRAVDLVVAGPDTLCLRESQEKATSSYAPPGLRQCQRLPTHGESHSGF